MERKKCIKPTCGRVFKAGDADFEDGYCVCGAPLMMLESRPAPMPVPETPREEAKPVAKQTIQPYVDEEDLLVFPGEEAPAQQSESDETDESNDSNVDQLILYHQGEEYLTMPLLYDELIIGRESGDVRPDLDVTPIDPHLQTSRRHAMLYRYKGKFFIRNLSAKKSLHVNGQPVLQNQDCQLEDGAQIVLSRAIGMEFLAKAQEGERK